MVGVVVGGAVCRGVSTGFGGAGVAGVVGLACFESLASGVCALPNPAGGGASVLPLAGLADDPKENDGLVASEGGLADDDPKENADLAPSFDESEGVFGAAAGAAGAPKVNGAGAAFLAGAPPNDAAGAAALLGASLLVADPNEKGAEESPPALSAVGLGFPNVKPAPGAVAAVDD